MQITGKGIREAAEKIRGLGSAFEADRFRRGLREALEPTRRAVIAGIHSETGRTAEAVETGYGKGKTISAYLTVNKRKASVPFHGRLLPYPIPVEAGHKGPHATSRRTPAHVFFRTAVVATRAEVRRGATEAARAAVEPYIGNSQIGGEFS